MCHLQSSGQLLGGRGHALGGPRKGPLWWLAHAAAVWEAVGLSGLGATSCGGLPGGASAMRPPPFMARPAGSQWTRPPAKPGGFCPFSPRGGGSWLSVWSHFPRLTLAAPSPGACGGAAVTSAHPRQGGSHVSCLAQGPPSVPIIGRATRRVLLTPRQWQRAQAWGGELAPFISQAPNYPFPWPGPRCF